jgi:accessory gene regulator B
MVQNEIGGVRVISKIAKKITNEIVLNLAGITEEKAKEIEYGLYMALSDGIKLIAVLITAFFLGQLKYCLVAVIVFSLNKSYLGGIHAKTQLGCLITHFAIIFGSVYIAKAIHFRYINIILFICAGILTFLYAPADLESKPILTEKRRKELKFKGSILLFLFFIITFFVPSTYSNVIAVITLVSTVILTPVVYKISKNRKGGVLYEKGKN